MKLLERGLLRARWWVLGVKPSRNGESGSPVRVDFLDGVEGTAGEDFEEHHLVPLGDNRRRGGDAGDARATRFARV